MTKLIPGDLPPADTQKEIQEFWRDILPDGRIPDGKRKLTHEMIFRRGKVAELWIKKGMSQAEIIEELGLSGTVVTHDIQWLMAQYLRRVLGDVKEHAAHLLMQLDAMMKELWDAWELSKEDEVIETETIVTRKGSEEEKRKTTQRKGKVPDTRIMRIMVMVWDRQAELLGVLNKDYSDQQESFLELLQGAIKISERRHQRFLESAVSIDEELEEYR